MGAVTLTVGDGTARFRKSALRSSALKTLMLTSVLVTNLFALYAFKFAPNRPQSALPLSDRIAEIVREIESSEKKLSAIEREILGFDTVERTSPKISPELKLFLGRNPLPLGRDARTGITVMVSSIAHSCSKSIDILSKFMSYNVGDHCPLDRNQAENLVSSGCDPLPRRRCRSRVFDGVSGAKIDEKMWVFARGKNDFLIDEVLPLGRDIRVGFDFNGNGGFALRMAERNVTVVTSVIKNGDFVKSRGLFSVTLGSGQSFPFQDSVFDIVHSLNGLEGVGGGEMVEFFLFDVDRVMRAGGLFWLDNWFFGDEKKLVGFKNLADRFGYKKLKWVVGEKADGSGSGKKICLSAVLQKPARG